MFIIYDLSTYNLTYKILDCLQYLTFKTKPASIDNVTNTGKAR
jgi:hypothetical protein